MKKLISVLLTAAMTFSSVGMIAGAEGEFVSEPLGQLDFQDVKDGDLVPNPPCWHRNKAEVWTDNALKLIGRVRAIFDEPVSAGKLFVEFEAATNSGCLGVGLMNKKETNSGVWAFGMSNAGNPTYRYFESGGYPPQNGNYTEYKDAEGKSLTVPAGDAKIKYKYKLTVDLDKDTVQLQITSPDGSVAVSSESAEYANLRDNAKEVHGLVFRNENGKTITIDNIKVYREDELGPVVIYASDFSDAFVAADAQGTPTSVWGNANTLNTAVNITKDAALVRGGTDKYAQMTGRFAYQFDKPVEKGAFCTEFDAMSGNGALAVSLVYDADFENKSYNRGKWVFAQGNTTGRLGRLKTWTQAGAVPPGDTGKGLVNLSAADGSNLNFTADVWEHYKITVDIDNKCVTIEATDSFGVTRSSGIIEGYEYFGGENPSIGGLSFRVENSSNSAFIDNISSYTVEPQKIDKATEVMLSEIVSEGGIAEVTAYYTIYDTDVRTVYLILASYDSVEGKTLNAVNVMPINLALAPAGDNSQAVTLNVGENDKYLKAFVFDENLQPLCSTAEWR